MKILALHGWGHDKTTWNIFIQIFKRYNSEIEIITLDFPGFGKLSDDKTISEIKDWNIDDYALWLKKYLENNNFELENLIILGHSFGGRIASYMLATHDFDIKLLILYGTPLIYLPSVNVKFIKKFAIIIKFLNLKQFIKFSTNIEYEEAKRKGLYKIYQKAVEFDQKDILKNIKIKTILLYGEFDTDADIVQAKLAQSLIPDSKLIILPNQNHNIHLENPILFTATIDNIINENI